MDDIDIARRAHKENIAVIGEKIGISYDDLIPFGHDKAKISLRFIESLKKRKNGKLILVTAISPTAAGEGKTTTTIGLGDALNRIGKKTLIALREPSLGPCFGTKGGATGGGYAQAIPMEDINLHFTGDFHAITAAHNLLAAMVDNHIYWGNTLQIDTRRISWKRVLDMNDRALRDIVTSLGGVANGYPRQSGFDITVASEIMAILCLAEDFDDLKTRLGRIVVGYTSAQNPVTAADLKAEGAMSVLLKDAMSPNLVQTLENNPVIIHGGPFANIAHGCNSVIATKTALKLADYVVTEAGFGADLGAEKFFDIKCRKAGLTPSATVIVATVRALKMNGGVAKADLAAENVEALKKGAANLVRHIENMRLFGLPVLVAVNHFDGDTEAETKALQEIVRDTGHEAIFCRHWAEGSKGAIELAEKLVALIEKEESAFQLLYPDTMPLAEKIETIVTRFYHGNKAIISDKIREQLQLWQDKGFGNFPVCMAKTQYSFSADPTLLGAPVGFDVPVREVRLAAGAGFIVVLAGNIMTMPGLPSKPLAEKIYLDEKGEVEGLS